MSQDAGHAAVLGHTAYECTSMMALHTFTFIIGHSVLDIGYSSFALHHFEHSNFRLILSAAISS
jgi:hypothetical protein